MAMTPSPTAKPGCPNCGKPISPGALCAAWGFDPTAGVVRRAQPHQTRGLEALAYHFGPRWSFGAAALMVFVIFVYLDDITTAEETGGYFSADPFTGMIYAAAGKWAVVGFWTLCAAVMCAAGIRALSIKRSTAAE